MDDFKSYVTDITGDIGSRFSSAAVLLFNGSTNTFDPCI